MPTAAEIGDTFQIVCLRCDRVLIVRRGWTGREVGCPFCASVLRVPEPVAGVHAIRAAAPSLSPQRYFNFPCPRCDVLLEAHTGMCGNEARCPTCAVALTVPRVDPATGLPEPAVESDAAPPENPTPLHAFAADGSNAPRIVRAADGTPHIRCTACGMDSPMDADRCAGCAQAFTIDAVPTGTSAQRRAAGVAAVALGSLGLLSVYLPFLLLPSLLALTLGLRDCSGRSGASAIGVAGAALGFVGLSGGVIGLAVL